MFLPSIFAALALSSVAFAKVIIVKVAPGDDLVFSPATIMADKGDQIQFEFEDEEHSVAQGDFDNACQPSDDSDAWFSGEVTSGIPQPWTITVDEEGETYPFYCTTPGHCQAGMVGVINPKGDDTLAAYKAAAAKTSNSGTPSKVQGGVFKAASAASAASSSSSMPSPTNAAGKMLVDSVAATVPLGIVAYMLL